MKNYLLTPYKWLRNRRINMAGYTRLKSDHPCHGHRFSLLTLVCSDSSWTMTFSWCSLNSINVCLSEGSTRANNVLSTSLWLQIEKLLYGELESFNILIVTMTIIVQRVWQSHPVSSQHYRSRQIARCCSISLPTTRFSELKGIVSCAITWSRMMTALWHLLRQLATLLLLS